MNEPMTMEIHSHSTTSDGKFSPSGLAELMSDAGVDLWALTDHDSIEGCDAAREAATELGLGFVPGIEVSAELQGESIHVLGYGVDTADRDLSSYGVEMTEARLDRMARMVDRMCELGVEVTLEDVIEVSGGGNLGRPHLAKALQKRGHVASTDKAFDRWLGTSRPGYVPMLRPPVVEAIKMIRDAGGMAVLAHPGRYSDVSEHFERWHNAGLWGLEVRHPSHNRRSEERLIRLADRNSLGKTASNDWHGHKPGDPDRLGRVVFPVSWQRSFFEALSETAEGLDGALRR